MPPLVCFALASALGAFCWPLLSLSSMWLVPLAALSLGLLAWAGEARASLRVALLLVAGFTCGLARVAWSAASEPGLLLEGELRARGRMIGGAVGREVDLALTDLAAEEGPWQARFGRVRLVLPAGEPAPAADSWVSVRARAVPLDPTHLPGAPDPEDSWRAHGVRTRLRARQVEVQGSSDWTPRTTLPNGRPALHEGLLRAMVDGDRSGIAEEEERLLKDTGTWHLVSISGLHVGLAAALAGALASGLLRVRAAWTGEPVPGWIAAATGIAAAWAYTALAGSPSSARRSAWMVTALLGCRALDRRAGAPELLALAWLGVLAGDPAAPWDVGGQLSFASVAGMILLAPRVMRWVPPDRPVLKLLAGSVAATVGATLGTLPVIAWRFQQLAPLGPVANLLAVPLVGTVGTPLLLLGQLLPEPLGPWAVAGADLCVHVALRGIAPLAVTPWTPAVGPLGMGLLLIAPLLRRHLILLGAALALALGLRGSPREMTLTFLSVGQGDATLVRWPDGRRWLIDGGPPGDGLLFWLRREGIRSLDALVLSHPHPDHLGGLIPVARALRIGELRAPRVPRAGEDSFAELIRLARAPLRVGPSAGGLPAPGDSWPAGVRLLHPLPGFVGPRDPVNDESLVVRVAHAGRTALFPGDVERAGEVALLQLGAAALRADILKVPHHGSRTSSHPAFLEAVRPELAVIGCGWRNRYGHPHAETLRSLAGSGARVLRTDLDGTVSVRWSEGTPLRVSFSGVSPEEALQLPTPQKVLPPASEALHVQAPAAVTLSETAPAAASAPAPAFAPPPARGTAPPLARRTASSLRRVPPGGAPSPKALPLKALAPPPQAPAWSTVP